MIVALVALSDPASGQTERDTLNAKPLIIGLRADYGFIIIHSRALREIRDSYPIAISADVSRHLLTQRAWDFCNCFPRMGVNLAYWYWDNPEVLGHGILATPYLEPYFGTHRRTSFFFRMAMGPAFLTKPHHTATNPDNLSYSTRFNFGLAVGAGINFRASQRLNMRLVANYNHISNGGVRTPNKGINYPALSLGIDRSIEPIDFPALNKNTDKRPPEKKGRISVANLSGWSDASASDKTIFYVGGIEAKYARWLGGRSAAVVGTEWIADFARREIIRLSNSDDDFQRGAALVGHEFWLGRVTFSQLFGFYYYDQFKQSDRYYQRYALTVQLTDRIYFGGSLKTHRHVADFVDARLGLVF